MRRRVALVLSIVLLGAGAVAANAPAHAASAIDTGAKKPSPAQPSRYRIKSGPVAAAMAERAGAAVTEQEDGFTEILATPSQADALRAQGLRLSLTSASAVMAAAGDPVDPGYTTYAQMLTAVDAIVASHPSIASKRVLGQSFEGKDIVALKISDNVADDENEPEILFTANQHAREHLTVEMALVLARMLTNDYGSDTAITNTVNDREIWILPMLNPDGVSFDLDSGTYQDWRKNRQPNSGTIAVGTDLNRNWGYKWGCCGGSSPRKSDPTYRGTAAFSAPETRVVRDFVLSRRVGGVQQIKEHIDIHTYSELVLWPFGYTNSQVVPNMTADQYAVHKAIGTEFAMANGYWPGQSSGLYITDGDIVDWLWGDQKIFSFTIEMFPKESDWDGFYPPSSVIPAETARNRAALLRFATWADCPFRAIGKENTYCPLTDDYSVTAPATATVAQGSDVTLNVSALTTAGSQQLLIMDTEGLPPAATATFSGSGLFLTDGSPETVTIHTTADTTPGTYTVVLTGDPITAGNSGRRTARVTLTVTGRPECAGTNGTDVAIPDNASSALSNITIAACGGTGGKAARVDIKIKHTHIGDLVIDLRAPSGKRFRVQQFGTGADIDDIDRGYTLDLSGESVDGTWTLDVSDLTSGDTGKIDSWSITLK